MSDLNIEGNKNNNGSWNLNVEIMDRYDFTDFVFSHEYYNIYSDIVNEQDINLKQKAKSSVKNGIGYTLNNMVLVLVQYGVLKEYDVKIKFNMIDYKIGD